MNQRVMKCKQKNGDKGHAMWCFIKQKSDKVTAQRLITSVF